PIRLVGDSGGEVAGCQLPLRALVGEVLGDGDGAPQRVVDRRRAGEQGVATGRDAVGLDRPQHLTAGLLQAQHELDGPLDHRPHGREEGVVARHEEVLPHPGGHVGDDVGVEAVVLDGVLEVVVEPRPAGVLGGGQPAVGALGFGDAPAEGQRHGGLDVVPRVAVPAGEPRDHAVGQLDAGDGVDRVACLGGTENSASSAASRAAHAAWTSAGRSRYMTMLLPMSGSRTMSASRVGSGLDVMSHTSSWWYAFTSGWSALFTPTAHLSHQYGECRPWVWATPLYFRPASTRRSRSTDWR